MSAAPDLPPIIAILRGVSPGEVLDVAGVIVEAGIRALEIPLNSPQPLDSIERLAAAYGSTCVCGAGTVLNPDQVAQVHDAGGTLIVAPNMDTAVIQRAIGLGLNVVPGFATPTEAFLGIAAGARNLKLFPADTYGAAYLSSLRAVLPGEVRIFAVGGVTASGMASWLNAGAYGVGIGGELYRPGRPRREIAERAAAFVSAYRASVGDSAHG